MILPDLHANPLEFTRDLLCSPKSSLEIDPGKQPPLA